MRASRKVRGTLAAVAAAALFAGGMATNAAVRGASAQAGGAVPGFATVVNLSHVNDPSTTPLYPGDPRFTIERVFTVHHDGFLLEIVHEGTHTGTHYSAPCHFHAKAACMDDLEASDLVLPAVVVDVREQVVEDPDYAVTVADLTAWEAEHGEIPAGAAVLLLTGCDQFWADGDADRDPTYYNCGTGLSGFHQPGFSRNAVKWLIDTGVLGQTGALGTDTFGPDPSSDVSFTPTSLTLRRHRVTIENLTALDELPAVGAWIVLGSPHLANGSGSPGAVFALVP
jgi:kynurenine formamidase